jgi:GNAT superfamily N-acetyltransferase
VRLRPAVPGDADAVAVVFVAARTEMRYLPRPEIDVMRCVFADRVLSVNETWVAEVDGAVVGFATLAEGILEHLYVHPDAQSRGIGTALLDKAKERRPDGLALWVFQQNAAARRLYEREGFALVELTDGAGNMERLPDALYEWRPHVTPRAGAADVQT